MQTMLQPRKLCFRVSWSEELTITGVSLELRTSSQDYKSDPATRRNVPKSNSTGDISTPSAI